jgi:hypothetical protein
MRFSFAWFKNFSVELALRRLKSGSSLPAG